MSRESSLRLWTTDALRKLRVGLSDPLYGARSLARDLLRVDERTIARWTGRSVQAVREFVREPIEDDSFHEHLAGCGRRLRYEFGDTPGGKPRAKGIRLQYALIRAALPETIVETGVASGVSTTHFLYALERNGRGSLTSIDLPDPALLPEGKDVGWMVPETLRHRWTLRKGDSRDLLPEVVTRMGELDVFVHDSLHTREHMLFELREAYPTVAAGGYMICDDADRNTAFGDFRRESGDDDAVLMRGVGFLRKGG